MMMMTKNLGHKLHNGKSCLASLTHSSHHSHSLPFIFNLSNRLNIYFTSRSFFSVRQWQWPSRVADWNHNGTMKCEWEGRDLWCDCLYFLGLSREGSGKFSYIIWWLVSNWSAISSFKSSSEAQKVQINFHWFY